MWQNFLHWLDENKTLFAYWCIRLVGLGFRFSKKTISKTDRKTGKEITESEKSFEFVLLNSRAIFHIQSFCKHLD